MNTYEISKFVFYDSNNYNYLNGLRINTMPRGPLKNYIKKISKSKLSPFESFYELSNQEQRCYYQIYNMENPSQPLLENNISVLFVLTHLLPTNKKGEPAGFNPPAPTFSVRYISITSGVASSVAMPSQMFALAPSTNVFVSLRGMLM